MKTAPKAASFDLNLAPMVDVMMCLLIFFMLATRMVEQENSRIDLPVARAAQDVETADRASRLVINITKTDDPGEPAYLIREEKRSLEEVLDFLAAESSRQRDLNCVIRADRDLAYGHVEAVLEGCAKAGVSNITFSALRSEGAGR